MSLAAWGMMQSSTIQHRKRKQENEVILNGLTARLTLPIWIWPDVRNTKWIKENCMNWGYMQKLSKGTFPYPSGIRWTEGQTSGSFISLQTILWMDAKCWIITEQDSNWNFALEMASSMLESPIISQQTSESWIFTSMHRSPLSTWPKRHVKGSEQHIPYHLASQ